MGWMGVAPERRGLWVGHQGGPFPLSHIFFGLGDSHMSVLLICENPWISTLLIYTVSVTIVTLTKTLLFQMHISCSPEFHFLESIL